MRDLGLMGENIFSYWCAEVGLVANGSKIDKTGWDFFVEFPFSSDGKESEIHTPALECKIQVKATDKTDRKLPISLSNLRRLITAQMPSFFIFIEFDGTNSAQRAFLVHVDESLITKTLKRLHEVEESEDENKFNKRTMTIHYSNEHELKELCGQAIKSEIERHIGNNISEYISKKKDFLESTGYEDGFAQVTFTTEGEDSFESLLNATLGLKTEIDIKSFKSTKTRFGIESKNALVDTEDGVLTIPNVEPMSEGEIHFKENTLSPGLSFSSKLYSSPLNEYLPDDQKKMRLEGEFFDILFNPITGKANFSFSFGEGVSMELEKFKSALKLLALLGTSNKLLIAELRFSNFPRIKFDVCGRKNEFNFNSEIDALESAIKIKHIFDISEKVQISFHEILKYSKQIKQLDSIFTTSENFKIEFSVNSSEFDFSNKAACVFTINCHLGSHIVGAILVLTGDVVAIEDERYQLVTDHINVERKIVVTSDDVIEQSDLVAAIEIVEKRYEEQYTVISSIEREC